MNLLHYVVCATLSVGSLAVFSPAFAEVGTDVVPVDSEKAASLEAQAVDASPVSGEFLFGSYGRVQAGFDPRGNVESAGNIVGHGPRLFQEDYAEFDFNYTLTHTDGFQARALFTLALFGPFAHYDGDFIEQAMAVRNLYVEVAHLTQALDGLSLWAGSRMYRGDDIYLLDWWPLDELNTVGAGVTFRRAGFDGRVHLGVNRLDNAYQFQTIEVPAQPIGSRTKVLLDRQRLLGSARLEYARPDLLGAWGAKAVLYGEYHRLPEGEYVPSNLIENGAPTQPEANLVETLSADSGFVLGAELGLFERDTANHLNLFFRYASGLAAYGELGVPFGTNTNGTADGASEILGALSGNWESHWVGVMAGAYLRRFEDANPHTSGPEDFVEGAAVVRPVIFITDHFHQAFELSYQHRYPFALDPDTGQHSEPGVFQLSVLELLSMERGDYSRPQLRLGYTVAFANEAAQRAYPDGDARQPEAIEHIVSIGAEWWFNSSTY